MVRLAAGVLLLSIIAACAALFTNSQLAAVLSLGLLLASIEIYLLVRRAGGFTAALIPILAVNTVFLTAPVLWARVQAEAIVSFRRFEASEELYVQTALIGIAFCAAYAAGAMLAGPRALTLSLAGLRGHASAVATHNGALLTAGYVAIALAIYGYQGALLRGQYLETQGPTWAVVLSTAGIPIAMLVLSIVAVQPGRHRALAIAGLALLALICFARASRVLAMLPAFLLIAQGFVSGGKLSGRSTTLASVSTGFLLLLPLAGRANPDGVGLVPLFEQLFSRPDEILSALSVNGLAGNILVSGPLTTAVASRPISSQAFWISVNPLPGGLAGWDEIKDLLRFNIYTPYNTLGELASQGWLFIVAFAAFAGFMLALSTRIASNLNGAYQMVASFLILAITVRFSLSILQYNLRNSARLIWWTALALSVIWLTSIVLTRRHHPSDESPGAVTNSLLPPDAEPLSLPGARSDVHIDKRFSHSLL